MLLQRLGHNFHLLEIALLVLFFLTLAKEQQESIFKLIDVGLTFDLSNGNAH
jgi:hypothetical protein